MQYKKRSESGNHCGKYVKVRNKNIYGCYIRKGADYGNSKNEGRKCGK